MELLIQMAYTTHRMKRWRIGTPEQLRSYTRDDLFDYFSRYYQPQNMIVTVTGKFDEDSIVDRVASALSGMKNGKLEKDFGPSEPPQKNLRYAMRRTAATQSYLHMGFHVPGVIDEEQPALEFLASLLSSGKSARLHRYVAEQRRSASSASAGILTYEDVGLLLISAVTEASKIRQAGRDVWDVLQDLIRNSVSQSEMLKVKNRLKLSQVMQTEDAMNLAELLSYYEAYGGYLRIEEHLRQMDELKEEQIIEVAKKYLQPSNLSVLEFVNDDIEVRDAESYAQHLQESFVAAGDFDAAADFTGIPSAPPGKGELQGSRDPARPGHILVAARSAAAVYCSRSFLSRRPQ